jgi:molybdopterin synthase catalytic subunit
MTNAPIVVFTYNRPAHTRVTIEALQKNIGAAESDLFIISDAAENNNSLLAVQEVRDYLKTVSGFKKKYIIERDKNGKLVEWVYAKEQTSQSMLKILGYK